MYKLYNPLHLLLVAASALALSSVCEFPWAARDQAMPIYDPATVVTVSGSVQSVEQHQCSLGWIENGVLKAPPTKWLGTHVILRTDYGILDAHIGPSSFLKEKHFVLRRDDVVEVTGSKLARNLPVVIIVKEIEKGGRFLELRDRAGVPLWKEASQ
ncbi:MAG TPA: hypothetical protein VE778_05750 [Candidatus Bathyarchaeia archaeon]|nr:hypothetical protein [Candidatus Bathyarchaeia archaeon]